MKAMQRRDLLKIGFTAEESEAFIRLLETGPATHAEVLAVTDLPADDLLEALEGLREKQLVRAVELWGDVYYSPIAEEEILAALEKAKDIIEAKKQAELHDVQREKAQERLHELVADDVVEKRIEEKIKDTALYEKWRQSKARLEEEHKSKVKDRLDDLVDEKEERLREERRRRMRSRLLTIAGKKKELPKPPDVTMVLEDILSTQQRKVLDQANPIFSDEEKVEIKHAITQLLSSKAAFVDQKKHFFKKG